VETAVIRPQGCRHSSGPGDDADRPWEPEYAPGDANRDACGACVFSDCLNALTLYREDLHAQEESHKFAIDPLESLLRGFDFFAT
jgi:hypothetical protein